MQKLTFTYVPFILKTSLKRLLIDSFGNRVALLCSNAPKGQHLHFLLTSSCFFSFLLLWQPHPAQVKE